MILFWFFITLLPIKSFQIHIGYQVKNHELARHIVSIRRGPDFNYFGINHFCGGTIISASVILTAAHCTFNRHTYKFYKAEEFEIVLGTSQRLQKSATTQVYKVKKIITYPNYDARTLYGDLALLHLSQKISNNGKLTNFITLQSTKPKIGELCITYGWGEILNMGPLSDELIFVNLTLLKPSECSSNIIFMKAQICAGDRKNIRKDTGRGDSGGPFVCKGVLTGVISYGYLPQSLSFYTDVWTFSDWIRKNDISKLYLSNWFFIFLIIVHCLKFI